MCELVANTDENKHGCQKVLLLSAVVYNILRIQSTEALHDLRIRKGMRVVSDRCNIFSY